MNTYYSDILLKVRIQVYSDLLEHFHLHLSTDQSQGLKEHSFWFGSEYEKRHIGIRKIHVCDFQENSKKSSLGFLYRSDSKGRGTWL